MSKANPLFVDSTKFHGDLISTQIELTRVLLYDDEAVFVIVTDHKGLSRRTAMKPSDDERAYEARVHLSHQTLVTFQFVIEKDGRWFMQSNPYKTRVQYALVETWEPGDPDAVPVVCEPPSLLQPSAPALPGATTSSGATNSNWARESSANLRSLMDRWGL